MHFRDCVGSSGNDQNWNFAEEAKPNRVPRAYAEITNEIKFYGRHYDLFDF